MLECDLNFVLLSVVVIMYVGWLFGLMVFYDCIVIFVLLVVVGMVVVSFVYVFYVLFGLVLLFFGVGL